MKLPRGNSLSASMRNILAILVVVSLVIGPLGCGFPPAPAYPGKGARDDAMFEAQDVQQPGLASDPAPALTLQPGDTVALDVESTERRAVPDLVIDGTGVIHIPLAGDIVVGGLGLTAAEQRVQEALRKFDRLATVAIRMTARGGHRATVLGAVTQQGPVPLDPGARVTDVMAGARGPITVSTGPNPVPVADLAGAVLMRQGKPIPISMVLALRGDPKHNVYVHPGDHIYVPPAIGRNVSVLGQVGSPAVFAHRPGLRLSEALALSGGVTAGADKGDIRVIRGTLSAPKVYQASLADFVDGDAHDVLLAPGDIIFVTDHAIEDINEVLGVVAPALSLGLYSVALAIALEKGE